MPTISMFYGIVIYLYFFDDERHKLPHITQNTKVRMLHFRFLMDQFFQVKSRKEKPGWFRPGLKFITMP